MVSFRFLFCWRSPDGLECCRQSTKAAKAGLRTVHHLGQKWAGSWLAVLCLPLALIEQGCAALVMSAGREAGPPDWKALLSTAVSSGPSWSQKR